jgi:hypothetical protein
MANPRLDMKVMGSCGFVQRLPKGQWFSIVFSVETKRPVEVEHLRHSLESLMVPRPS